MCSDKLSILNRLDKVVNYSSCFLFYYCVVLMIAILSSRGSKWEKTRWPQWIHSEPTSKHVDVVTTIEPSRSGGTLESTDNNRAVHNPSKYGICNHKSRTVQIKQMAENVSTILRPPRTMKCQNATWCGERNRAILNHGKYKHEVAAATLSWAKMWLRMCWVVVYWLFLFQSQDMLKNQR